MMDRGLRGRTKGGPCSLSGVLRLLTPQQLQSISPVHFCLPTFTDSNNFAVEWIDYLPSQPTLAFSTSIRLPLRACSEFHHDVFKWQVIPQLSMLSMTCTGHCRITQKKTPLCDIWRVLSQPCAVYACMCAPAFLNSAPTYTLTI